MGSGGYNVQFSYKVNSHKKIRLTLIRRDNKIRLTLRRTSGSTLFADSKNIISLAEFYKSCIIRFGKSCVRLSIKFLIKQKVKN